MPIEFSKIQGTPPPAPPASGAVGARFSVFTGQVCPALESLGHRDPAPARPLHTRQVEQGEAPLKGAIGDLRSTPEPST